MKKTLHILLLITLLIPQLCYATRLKDIANFKGVRSNQLIGYGLVVGLDGTGDSSSSDVMKKTLAEALAKMGVGVDAEKFQIKNVASVMVTSTLPAFAKMGSTVDVLVSSIGDAKSLQGGTLLMTPLKAANQEVYAVAQGPVSIGGYQAEAPAGGSQVKTNHQTVAKLTNGATVEREVDYGLEGATELTLAINEPDFTTAVRIATVINEKLESKSATAEDSGGIKIKVPPAFKDKIVTLIASLESLEIEPDVAARVVLNERTGTVVMGENVRVSTVAVSHGSLSIQIDQSYNVSQPNALAKGETVVTPETDFYVDDSKEKKLVLVPEGVNIGEIIRALNAIGVTPRDLISVLQAIKAAGALQGELVLI
ncbi:flagellar basal body P-ring protein FlgI [bacterium]|nr:flagellar basal body P-ring protein FlgI [bacterium]